MKSKNINTFYIFLVAQQPLVASSFANKNEVFCLYDKAIIKTSFLLAKGRYKMTYLINIKKYFLA